MYAFTDKQTIILQYSAVVLKGLQIQIIKGFSSLKMLHSKLHNSWILEPVNLPDTLRLKYCVIYL